MRKLLHDSPKITSVLIRKYLETYPHRSFESVRHQFKKIQKNA